MQILEELSTLFCVELQEVQLVEVMEQVRQFGSQAKQIIVLLVKD
jgi:hypothetical protein